MASRKPTLSRAQVATLLIVLALFVVALVVSVEAARMAAGGE